MISHTLRFGKSGPSSRVLHRAVFAVLASSIVGFTATAAQADTVVISSDVPAVSVSYSDLNLATEQGAVALYKRIVTAARQVCPADVGPNLRLISQTRHCVNEAVARAVSDIPSPKLAELQMLARVM